MVFIGVVAAGVLAFLAHRSGQKKVKRARVIKCKVADMRDGDVVRVKGRLVTREAPLKSPLTNRLCVYFRFKVEQAIEVRSWTTTHYGMAGALAGPQETMSTTERWTPVLEDEQRVSVALEDETGTANLDLADAQLEGVTKKQEGVIDTSKETGLQFEIMLQKRYGESTLVDRRSGVSQSFSRRSSRMSQGRELPRASVHEEIIEDGVSVYVVGEVEILEGRSPRFRPTDHPLIVAKKASRASLPTPTNPAMGLWIAAGVVLGVSLLIGMFALFAACAGMMPVGGPRIAPPVVKPMPGR
jgi:hypothetical protein